MRKHSDRKTSAGNAHKPRRSPKQSARESVVLDEVSANDPRFASFLNQLPGLAWIKDLEGRYVYANSALQKLETFREGWLGKTDAALWPKEIAEKYQANDRQVIAEGKPLETLEPFTVNGRLHMIAVSKFPILDSSGAVILVGGAGVDISERVLTAERLREYERVVEALEEMIAVVDRDYRYLLANQSFLENRGLKREEIVGRFVWEVLGRDLFEQTVKAKFDESLGGNVVQYEMKYNHPKNGPRDLFVAYFPIRTANGIDRVACIVRDITKQKTTGVALHEAERRYREIFQNAGEGIFQTRPEGRFIVANPALAEMFGFDTPEELIRDCSDISRQIYVDPYRRHEFMRVLETSGFVRGFEAKAFRKDGTQFWMSLNARTVRDSQGRILYYEGTAQDISERKRAELTSSAFATLARRLSGASTNFDAALIIAETARNLFGWHACNLDLYDEKRDVVDPLLNVDTIKGRQVDVTPLLAASHPTARGRRVLANGPELILRQDPVKFDTDSVPFGDKTRPAASIMNVPIKHRNEIVGLLSIQSYTVNAYDETSLNDLVALAEHCGEALNRIRAEKSFRESEERYRDLVENSHEFICTHDLNGVILSANKAAAVALGFDLDKLVGKGNIRDILAPAYRDQFEEYIERLKSGLATSGIMVVQTSSGEQRFWEYYNSLRTEGVTEPIVRGIARDITEQRQAARALRESEERYRELFENSRDAIYVHDLKGRYVSVNRAAEELSGFSREEILGKHYSRFVAPRYLKDVRKNFCRKLDVPVETAYETTVVCKNGVAKPIEVSSRIIHKDGVAVGVQGTARDITERKRAQEALQTYARRLVDVAEAERQKIARELHDEIGQVLTAVRLSLQRIERDCETVSCFPRITEGIEVVDEALAKVRELSWELRPSLLDDLGLAAALRWYVARYTERTGINAEVLGAPVVRRIPPEVEVACFRIIQEALTNTARHSGATEASVYLERKNKHLRLTVSDNGIGFQSAALLNGLAASALGLRGMHERALAVDGQVEVNSTVGRGTQVIINVPLGRAGK